MASNRILYRLPFPNPDLADGWHSRGYWDDGRYVKRVRPHQGVDFPQPSGTPIPAIADGTVAAVQYSGELGWVVVLKHARTKAERLIGRRDVFSFYCHQSINPGLAIGAHVHLGDDVGRIGVQGRNGTAAAGAHLHLAMSHDVEGGLAGRTFDPIKYIRARLK